MTTAHQDIGSLVSAILDFRETFPADLRDPVWYRGVRCSQIALIPSLYRFGPVSDAKAAVQESLTKERRLLTLFRQRSLPMWPAGYQQDVWEQQFVMQHNGLPTRLLDWSENFFIALFFALLEDRNPCPAKSPHTCQPVVWALNPVVLNRQALSSDAYDGHILTSTDPQLTDRYEPGRSDLKLAKWPLAMMGTHNSARMVAQRGVFTIFGVSSRSLADQTDELSDYPVHHGVDETKNLRSLTPLVVDSGKLADLRSLLRTLGFGQSMVYPDMFGLAQELNQGLAAYGE